MGGSHHEYIVLDRGAACLECKRRKKRCDGVKPVCGPCIRVGTADQCEFPVPPAPKAKLSKTPPKLKREALKNQIRELEERLASMHRVLGTVPPASEVSSSSAEPRTSPMDDDRPHSSSSGTGEGSPALVWGEDLLHIFLQYRHRYAFVVHEARFVQKFQHHLQSGGAESRDSMHPSLVNAVFLVACHFASTVGDTRYEEYEGYFLRKTREELETSLTAADRLTDFVYATALLVWYYFSKGRIAEAQYHASGLACFVGACRMNVIDPNARDFTLILPPATDDIELEERVTLFWSIFILDRYSSLLCNTPSTIRDETVWSPWPRPADQWHIPRHHELRVSSPASMILSHMPSLDYTPLSQSVVSFRALGTYIIQRTTHLEKAATSQLPQSEYDITLLTQNYESSRETVRRLSSWLPPVSIESPEDTTPTATMSFAPQQPFDSNALALHNTQIPPSISPYPGSASSSHFAVPSPPAAPPLPFVSSSAPASGAPRTPSSNVSPFFESPSNMSSPVSQGSRGSPPANPERPPMESAALIYAHSAVNAAWIHLNATANLLPLSAPFQSPFLVSQTHSQRSLSLSPPPSQFAAPSPSSSGSSHYSRSPPYSQGSQSPVSQPPWSVPDPWNLQEGRRTLEVAREIAELARMAYFDPAVFEELDMMISLPWIAACQILTDELTQRRVRRSESHPSSSAEQYAHPTSSPYGHPMPQVASTLPPYFFSDSSTSSPHAGPSEGPRASYLVPAHLELDPDSELLGERDLLVRALDKLGGMFRIVAVMRRQM